MKTILTNIKSPALISLLITLPFILLELVIRRNFNEGFPFPLFGILWLLPMAFILIIRDIQVQNKPLFLIHAVLLLIISIVWVAIIKDQLPCFLGVANCD